MKIILLGAPGAGKGSYAKRLKQKLNMAHISTGDLLREAIEKETEIGLEAKEFVNKGLFVPDEIIVNLLLEKLSKKESEKGILLDGFPRTKKQAEILDETIGADLVLNFDVKPETVLERLGGRLICKGCGEIYNKNKLKPKTEGICDKCESELYQREDDMEETILDRLDTYQEQTSPLIEYYKNKGILHTIEANKYLSDPTCTIMQDCEQIIKDKLE